MLSSRFQNRIHTYIRDSQQKGQPQIGRVQAR